MFNLSSNINVEGMPKQVKLSGGLFFVKIDNLTINKETECVINFISKDKNCNPNVHNINVSFWPYHK